MKYKTRKRHGFSLIEILIAIAIIAIMSGAAIIGFGRFTVYGRDSRRVGDLATIQTALELYYNKNNQYPAATSWSALETALEGAGVGVNNVPNDPRSGAGATYVYANSTGGTTYVLKAVLEDPDNAAFSTDVDGTVLSVDCTDANLAYCVQL